MLITYQSTLLEKEEIAPQIVRLSCSRPKQDDWSYLAGQYMIIHVPQADNHPARRLYSIASHPSHENALEFIIEIIPQGVGGAYISKLSVGDTITLQGAAGMFTYKSSGRSPVFVATGTGIAPMRSMLLELEHQQKLPQQASLLWGLKFKEDLYIAHELFEFKKRNPSITIKICLSREEHMESIPREYNDIVTQGRVTAYLDNLDSRSPLSMFDYYLCGGKHVVEGLREYLSHHSIPDAQVFFEKFT